MIIRLLIAFLLSCSAAIAGVGIGITPYPGPGMLISTGGSYATPAYVSSNSVYDGGVCNTNASVSAIAGNTLVMAVSGLATQVVAGVTTYTGSTSDWTLRGTYTYLDVDINIYTASVSTTGTVAARPACSTTGDAGYALLQYSGIDTASPLIGAAQVGGGTATSFTTSGNVTTTTPALLVGVWASETFDATLTWGTGYTERVNQNNHVHKVADRVTSAAGDYNLSGTSSASGDQTVMMVALKAASL